MDPDPQGSDNPGHQNVIPSRPLGREDITVELESDDLCSVQLARSSLVGKIMGEKALNKGAVKRHEQKDCKEDKIMDSFNPAVPKYGPKLGVPPARPIISIMKEQGFWSKGSSSTMADKGEIQQEEGDETKNQEREYADKSTDNPGGTQSMTEQTHQGVAANPFHNAPTNQAIAEPPQPTNDPDNHDRGEIESDSTRFQGNPLSSSAPIELFPNPQKDPHLFIPPSCVASGPGVAKGPSPTLVDLPNNTLQPGLGPKDLKDLGVQPEFIGLKEPVIILDYPSPEIHKYDGARLTSNEIALCKKKCIAEEPDLRYIVEFPPDEDEDVHLPKNKEVSDNSLNKEEEKRLIVGWNRALSLKRNFEQLSSKTDISSADFQKVKPRKVEDRVNSTIAPQHYAAIISEQRALFISTTTKAEEAGQTMPHPQP
ncbi:hypothetical protein SESBI_45508 [Sesbania bispinosa]|nr:hypothetical protein SESBI_45508 [Sesbania bispinosa]